MRDEIELRHLRYFVGLAGERHFGRAAAALHVTQPLLSRQIRALEKLLGVPLLARTRPTVELTSAGTLFFEQAQQVLQHVDRAARATQRAVRGKETIALALEPCSSFHDFQQTVRRLHRTMPDLQLEVHELPVGEHAHRLRSGQIDIAYGHKAQASEGIQFTLLSSEPLLIGLPSSHRMARRKQLDIVELADEPFVFWHRAIAPACHDYILDALKSLGVSGRAKHNAPDHGKLLAMIAAGSGWTVAPACASKAQFPGVIFRRIRGAKTRVDLGISFLAAQKDPTVRAVIHAWKKTAVGS